MLQTLVGTPFAICHGSRRSHGQGQGFAPQHQAVRNRADGGAGRRGGRRTWARFRTRAISRQWARSRGTARSILRKGFVISVQCTEDCRHVTRLFVNKSQARKLAIKKKARKRVLVGQKTTLLKANVAQNVRVKLSTKAKQGIRRMKSRKVKKLRLTVTTSARDASNNVRNSKTTLAFKR